MLEIDNNTAERELRSIAVGRNNWTFLGSDGGGNTAAAHFSFVSSCRRHDVDP
ncbi:MAG: transposase [Planctomycetia bacterium]|nr:transposase [Planctomycetia bacterium]